MNRTRWLTQVGVLGALSAVLMFFSIPLPFVPDFLRLDLAELPALVGLFTVGPLGAVAIEGIKNIVHLMSTRTFGIGEMANFIIGSSLVLGTYWGLRWSLGMWLSLMVGVLVMAICAGFMNFFLLIPLYAWALGIPIETLVSLGHAANPHIIDLRSLILWGIMPFNLVKGCLVSVAAASVLPRLKRWLNSEER
jgi:Predicted membrane protein